MAFIQTPHLRALKLYFHPIFARTYQRMLYSPNHRHLYRRKHVLEETRGGGLGRGSEDSSGNVEKEPILPLCQKICGERGISFSVEIRLFMSYGEVS